MNLRYIYIVLFLLIGCNQQTKTVFTETDIKIIPKPQELTLNEGSFIFNADTKFVVTSDIQLQAAQILVNQFKIAADLDLGITKEQPESNFLVLKDNSNLSPEAYTLTVNNDNVIIEAFKLNGFVYGIESVRQLLPVAIESQTVVSNVQWEIPNVKISDAPRYKWRGLMLDVSRHFFDKEYVKKTIDRLAYLKMNTLHLHLVDDQGWRIEIKKYPKLTEVGGFRVDHEDKHWNARPAKEGEKAAYGGFYTQEDIKEIVAHAQSRGITVVPEIEMPAHVMSAIASYPYLSCFETPISVPSGGVWPITEIYCPGKESTFEFLEDVLIEVMELFPSKYIHVGGDEATKTNWKKCPHCKARMKSEGLKNVEELQSYFIKRMERFISSKGRVLIGWDEILEGGLAPGATVMSWRGVKGGLEASEQGHDVVMTPGTHCYFDHYQGPQDAEPAAWGGYLPLSKVYEFDPVVEGMTEEQAKHVLGGQANLWAEYIPTTDQSEYMIFPRIAALSETLWSSKEERDWNEFTTRIIPMFDRFEAMGINYAKSIYTIREEAIVDEKTGNVSVSLSNEIKGSDIRYVLDEADLETDAIKYEKPIQITKTTTIKAAYFENDKPVGAVFEKTFKYHKAVGKKVTYNTEVNNRYQGTGETTQVNVLRGTKNFHDGQWQAWLGNDMEVIIDLEVAAEVSKVSVGALENQGPGIYFPTKVEVWLSDDGETYTEAGSMERLFKATGDATLKDFVVKFDAQKARYVKVKATNLKQTPTGGGVFLFVDEIIVE
ncbi:family 20 glycosylhydrolase [Galbibacter sp. EGI 63066]|uniref:glycoside hydrolase family 20 protein n=1 Tax=Galbibacter sp. EGI 63066 TaxID=2993559 RepID=UPI0022491B9E|nr:family 20 glycosylhydrolase [Galbibacter sp. EGI 63066]MCX2681625.1 family 20 glycosylhydrolase [Galbibacter sp. EGI 63066]